MTVTAALIGRLTGDDTRIHHPQAERVVALLHVSGVDAGCSNADTNLARAGSRPDQSATTSPHRRPAKRIQPLPQLVPCVAVQHLNDTVGIKFHPGDHLCPELDPLQVALDRSGQFP